MINSISNNNLTFNVAESNNTEKKQNNPKNYSVETVSLPDDKSNISIKGSAKTSIPLIGLDDLNKAININKCKKIIEECYFLPSTPKNELKSQELEKEFRNLVPNISNSDKEVLTEFVKNKEKIFYSSIGGISVPPPPFLDILNGK
ncbi:MAG: hypothetical protein U0354_17520 [Candidatus Sericytochromatia bacterium]